MLDVEEVRNIPVMDQSIGRVSLRSKANQEGECQGPASWLKISPKTTKFNLILIYANTKDQKTCY